MRYTTYRSLTTLIKTGIPGPEGSGAKLWWSEANQRVTKLALELLGPEAQVVGGETQGLLAAPAASLAREHDRGRHLRDPAQHHRRARARPPPESLMDFAFTQEQEELRREARAFLEANPEAPLGELRDLGWLGVSVPEERGGGGLSFLDEAILFEEAGRALYSGPFLTTAVVLPALPEVDEQAWSVEVDGFVPDLLHVDRVLTRGDEVRSGRGRDARDDGRDAAARPAHVHRRRHRRRASGSRCASASSPRSRSSPSGSRNARSSSAIAYVSDREQFGKKIGIYQAVSHPLADTYVETELARSLAYWAAFSVAEEDEGAAVAVASAKSFCAETAVAACERSIQVHGGIGFTWEHPLHRYYKRAQWLDAFGGHAAVQRAVVAAALLD